MNDEREGAGFLDTVNAEDQMKGLIQKQKTMSTIQENPPPPPPLQKCPRCDSINTKFCYYNNYSLSQPRYFCKTCRRYWTKGGTLRNVPVGGGCRKGKRTKKSISSSSSTTNDPITSNDIGTFTSFMASSISGAGEGGLMSSIPQIQTLSVNDLMGFECPFNSSINQLIPLYQDFSIGKERTVNQFLQMDSSFSSMIKPPSLNEDWKPAYENPNADYWNNNNLPGVGPSSSSSSLL